jgi:hypothetical protein
MPPEPTPVEIYWRLLHTKYQHIQRHHKGKAFLFVAGYVLSPFSWWNDLFINLPLSWVGAWIIGKIVHLFIPISHTVFLVFFLLCYWLTNISGLLLMKYAITNQENNKNAKKILLPLVVGLVYSLLAVILDHQNIINLIHFYPGWVG